ncbi:MAG: hypothetical protein AcusKO_29570 [Acuticoccus sp.]
MDPCPETHAVALATLAQREADLMLKRAVLLSGLSGPEALVSVNCSALIFLANVLHEVGGEAALSWLQEMAAAMRHREVGDERALKAATDRADILAEEMERRLVLTVAQPQGRA